MRPLRTSLSWVERQTAVNAMLVGRALSRSVEPGSLKRLADAEFRVFSQWGDDGIIQYLVRTLGPLQSEFVEFGVGDYSEANTLFLLRSDNWRGLVMDASEENMHRVQAWPDYWRYDVTARPAFVTIDNVNALIADQGFRGSIGLLHIDIDGNDYWIWRAVEVVEPAIVIVEYNSVFGPDRAVTIPYQPSFNRFEAHPSGLYFGASLSALQLLAAEKGYVFVGCNSAGNNAYFVRHTLAERVASLLDNAAFVESRFRESRNATGTLTFLSGSRRLDAIRGLPVINVRTTVAEPL